MKTKANSSGPAMKGAPTTRPVKHPLVDVLPQPPFKIQQRPYQQSSVPPPFQVLIYHFLDSLPVQVIINTGVAIKEFSSNVVNAFSLEP